jgi:hypothetical protein
MLTSVLLGLSRAFRAGPIVRRQRPRYVEPAPSDEALSDFIATLQPVIDRHCRSLAGTGNGGTTVVEVHRVLSRKAQAERPPAEAISVSVEEDGRIQRLVLHGPPGRRAGAARTLVAWLARDTQSARA